MEEQNKDKIEEEKIEIEPVDRIIDKIMKDESIDSENIGENIVEDNKNIEEEIETGKKSIETKEEKIDKTKIKEEKKKAEVDIKKIVYESDASQIKGKVLDVFIPETVEQVREIVKNNLHITPRGAGTGLAGGAVPNNTLVLDLSKLNKIIEINKARKEAYVEAGIILDELNSKLEKYGLEFPINLSSHETCTIGGMIATNAVGSRAVKYGRTVNWINELEIINSDGEILKKGKADLNDYAGMEGTTAIIVRARLKLINRIERTVTLFSFESLSEMMEIVRKYKLNSNVSMIEFLDKQASELIGLGRKYNIILEFESDEGKLKGKEYETLMQVRDKIYPSLASLGYVIIEDPKMFLTKIPELLEYLEKNKIPTFGHLGVGILHPCFMPSEKDKINKMMGYIKKLHGSITGEHGIGILKKEFLDETEKKLIRVVKKRLDASNKFNPGKIVDFEEKGEEGK